MLRCRRWWITAKNERILMEVQVKRDTCTQSFVCTIWIRIVCCWWQTVCSVRTLLVLRGCNNIHRKCHTARCRDKCNFMSHFSTQWKHTLAARWYIPFTEQFYLKFYSRHDTLHTGTYEMFSQGKRATHAEHLSSCNNNRMFDTEIEPFSLSLQRANGTKISNDNDQMDLMPSNVQ